MAIRSIEEVAFMRGLPRSIDALTKQIAEAFAADTVEQKVITGVMVDIEFGAALRAAIEGGWTGKTVDIARHIALLERVGT